MSDLIATTHIDFVSYVHADLKMEKKNCISNCIDHINKMSNNLNKRRIRIKHNVIKDNEIKKRKKQMKK